MPGSEGNEELFFWHQVSIHLEVILRQRATQPTYIDILEYLRPRANLANYRLLCEETAQHTL